MSEESNKKSEAGSPAWMATFGDLMSLLLTFFILLLSFAEMDIVKFKDAMGSIQEELGVFKSGSGMFKPATTPSVIDTPLKPSLPQPKRIKETIKEETKLKSDIEEKLRALIQEKGLEKDVSVEKTARGVVVRVRGRLFFNPGTADIKDGIAPLLNELGEVMQEFPYDMSIEGHTDNIPIRSRRFSSNWELSAARAYSALKYLNENKNIDTSRLNIAGFSDTRPLTSNDTPDGRAKNRRVEFVFYKQGE
jgi:chemotaxis protein MotB